MNQKISRRLTSRLTVSVATIAAFMMFGWPLLIGTKLQDQAGLAQAIFIVLMPMLIALILIEFSSGGLDSRRLAILGVLAALNAAIRLLGAGVSGIETAFFLIILGGFVFGASFGFILGATSLFLSALIGAGVGPWLPFQMMAAGLVGLGAGAIGSLANATSQNRPRAGTARNSKAMDLLILVAYGIVASFGYGALMTMWNWPFLAGVGSQISYSAGASIAENITRFLRFELFTGGLLWDLGRAVTTSVLLSLSGTALLTTLRRAANRAGFSGAK